MQAEDTIPKDERLYQIPLEESDQEDAAEQPVEYDARGRQGWQT